VDPPDELVVLGSTRRLGQQRVRLGSERTDDRVAAATTPPNFNGTFVFDLAQKPGMLAEPSPQTAR
jgi:hypothetical protein